MRALSCNQAVNNNCGQGKAIFTRSALLSIKDTRNYKLLRCTRKRLFELRIWNFSRCKPKGKKISNHDVNPLSILQGNVRSCRNKLDELTASVLTNNCSLNFFTESWLDDEVSSDSVNIDGFHTLRRDRGGGVRGGGILGYIKNEVVYQELMVSNPHNLEILALHITHQNLLVIVIYFPFWNNPEKNKQALDHLFEIVSYAKNLLVNFNYNLLLVGDLNDLRYDIDVFLKFFKLKNVVNFSTRGNNTLDCVFSTNAKRYTATKLAPLGKSDHCLIKCTGKAIGKRKKTFVKRVPDYSPANKQAFHAMMYDTNFTIDGDIKNSCDLNFYFDNLLAKIHSIYDRCFPLRKVKCHTNSLPWMNDSIRICISKRDRAYCRGQIVRFKHYRQKVKFLIKEAKKSYMSTVNELQSSSSWSKIKDIGGIKRRATSTPSTLNANLLLNHFTSIKPEDSFIIKDVMKCHDEPIQISSQEVACAIKNLKKGGGVPFIHPWIIRNYADLLLQPMHCVFNASMNLGYIPSSMKVASITPVPKVKQPKSVDDFRPITCASPFLKILEFIVYNKWLKGLIKEVNFSDQFAFIPLQGRGCTTALLTIYGTALQHIDAGRYVNLLLIDLSKAFDRAATSVILNQLQFLNASRQCVLWTADFLQNRHVCVKFNGEFSKFEKLSGGTPQGSLISPLLFAILCQSLQPLQNNFTYVKYADDLTVVHHSSDPSNCTDLQAEVDHISQWCLNNFMKINETKTKIMHVHIRKQPCPPVVKINNTAVEIVKSSKLLGLYFHSSLKWREHVDLAVSKASKLIFPILQLKRCRLKGKILLKLYQLLIRPHLTYASAVTINMSQQEKLKLKKMERRCLNIIGSVSEESLDQFVDRLASNLAKSVLRYELHPFRQLLQTVAHRKTRSQQQLRAPRAKTSLMKNSFVKFFK